MTRNEITAVYDNVARQTKPFAKERLREFVVYFAELIAELERNECAEICEDYQAQIKELSQAREYVPMTRTEWNELIEQYSANEHNTPWRRFIEAEVIQRAKLIVKESGNG